MAARAPGLPDYRTRPANDWRARTGDRSASPEQMEARHAHEGTEADDAAHDRGGRARPGGFGGMGAEQLGTVKSVNEGQKTVLLSDGTQLWLLPGLSTELFVQGKRVKIVYDDRDGKRWVRSVEATN